MLVKRKNTATAIEMNALKRESMASVQKKLKDGIYRETENSCLCEKSDDWDISDFDRFRFSIKTKLCKCCGLMRSDPYYDSDTIDKFYDCEYRPLYVGSNECTDGFFDNQKSIGTSILKFSTDFLSADMTVHEIGCGAGGILTPFRELGCRVSGNDLGSEYIVFGKKKGLELHHGDFFKIAENREFDLIILNHVLEHVTDPVAFATKLHDKLAPQGFLYVGVPGIDVIPVYYHNDIALYLQNAHAYHYCQFTLSEVLKKAGFKCIKSDYIIRSLYVKDINDTHEQLLQSDTPADIYGRLKKYEDAYHIKNG